MGLGWQLGQNYDNILQISLLAENIHDSLNHLIYGVRLKVRHKSIFVEVSFIHPQTNLRQKQLCCNEDHLYVLELLKISHCCHKRLQDLSHSPERHYNFFSHTGRHLLKRLTRFRDLNELFSMRNVIHSYNVTGLIFESARDLLHLDQAKT